MKDRISITVLELNEEEDIVNRERDLNEILMSIDIEKDIHQQASKLGYSDIYTVEDIENEIKNNIKQFGGA